MRTFIDTNVIAYMFDADSPDKQRIAQQVFEHEVGEARAVLSTQVLQETFVSLTRKFATPLPPDDAECVVRDLAELPVVQPDTRMVLAAIGRSRAAALSFWDSLIVEAALTGGCSRLLTEDLQYDQVIGTLRVENPFV